MKQRSGGLLFGIGVGLVFAFMSYQWITNPAPREERQLEEAVVLDARNYLIVQLGVGEKKEARIKHDGFKDGLTMLRYDDEVWCEL